MTNERGKNVEQDEKSDTPSVDRATGESSTTDDDEVDEAGRESFPASDPPAWNAGRLVR